MIIIMISTIIIIIDTLRLMRITTLIVGMGIIVKRKKRTFLVSSNPLNLIQLLMDPAHRSFVNFSPASCMKFMTWNSSSIMPSASYLSSALQRFDIDICGISEHWLYKKELHFLDSIHRLYIYAAVADFDLERPSKRKVGKGGVA